MLELSFSLNKVITSNTASKFHLFYSFNVLLIQLSTACFENPIIYITRFINEFTFKQKNRRHFLHPLASWNDEISFHEPKRTLRNQLSFCRYSFFNLFCDMRAKTWMHFYAWFWRLFSHAGSSALSFLIRALNLNDLHCSSYQRVPVSRSLITINVRDTWRQGYSAAFLVWMQLAIGCLSTDVITNAFTFCKGRLKLKRSICNFTDTLLLNIVKYIKVENRFVCNLKKLCSTSSNE